MTKKKHFKNGNKKMLHNPGKSDVDHGLNLAKNNQSIAKLLMEEQL
ncbi:hypothetical protein SSU05_0386 [Streptococcus suis 05ZYH33]|nr:hypothetical protein SSU05_0386 [Streptococcus suis 05ZYH33]